MNITIALPPWLDEMMATVGPLAGDADRVGFAIEMARRNVAEETGGPFAAFVLDETTGEVIAAGVNVVVPTSTAIAHGETIAVAAAGQKLESFDLGVNGPTGLYTSCEPCLMCLGATIWSGVSRLVIGARDADAAAIGFDEGPKPDSWPAQLGQRGIEVVRDVQRGDAARVLADYGASGAAIYNADRP